MKKVLVVDDDRDIREIMMMILEDEGYVVSGLDNGSAVIATVRETRPDVLLLDVQLGDRDGRDICRELKDTPNTHDIPIIMVSATHGWSALRDKNCHANDFLAKPFDVAELLSHVKRFAA
ncbi:response regulator transcription factor [Mucilaginibacter corticis]|nr:response regulator [Mucilaginibacter corticis]